MPRMDAAIYAAHMDSTLKMARREGGVSKPQLINELNVTRTIASGLITKCELEPVEGSGRTKFFTAPSNGSAPAATPSPEVKQSVVPTDDGDHEDTETLLEKLAKLDSQILATRTTLCEHATLAGAALGEWAKHQALVDALRAQMTELASRRLKLSS